MGNFDKGSLSQKSHRWEATASLVDALSYF
jgi:hypothetical protein